MPTTVLYRAEWTEFGEQFRLDIIPRGTADLPGGYSVVTLPKDFIRGWKVESADFPSAHPWGLAKAPGLVLDLNFRALGASSDLSDLRGYLQDASVVASGKISPDGTSEDLRMPNVAVLLTDAGAGGTPTEVLFVGCQRLLPGLSSRMQRVGQANYTVSTEIIFAHAAMYCLENIPTDWLARRAIADETPEGPFSAAYNLMYYDTGTSRLHTLREHPSDNSEFYLYSVEDMFGDHLTDLMTLVYDAVLRNAYGAVTYAVRGYDASGNAATSSPVLVPRYFKADYTTSYGQNGSTPLPDLYVKGVIEAQGSVAVGDDTIGGWYSELSDVSVYQWENCWDMMKAMCDTCKAVFQQTAIATLDLAVLPILSPDARSGSSITLDEGDILGGSVTIDHQAGIIRSARVSVRAAGSDDRSDHETVAVGIRADDEVTATVLLHNQVPLWDAVTQGADLTGYINGSLDQTIAEIEAFTTDTLYYVDTAVFDPTGSNITLTTQDVPIMACPLVDIRRARATDFYTDGYDSSAYTPLPATATLSEYPDDIEGAVIEMQRNACLPHVLSQYIVSEFGAGSAQKPVTYELEIGRKTTQKVRLSNLGMLITLDPDTFLPTGESYWSELPSSAFLVGWAPDSKKGTVKLTLFGYTV